MLAIIWGVLGLISLLISALLSGTPNTAIGWNIIMIIGSIVIGFAVLELGQIVIWAGHLAGQLLGSILTLQPQFEDGKAEKQDQFFFTATHKFFWFMWVAGHIVVTLAILAK